MLNYNFRSMLIKPGIGFLTLSMLIWSCGEIEEPELAGDSWEDVEETGHGSITALYVPADGFAYKDNQGRLTGVTVEIIQDFAKYLADEHDVVLQLNFVEEEDWSTFYDKIADGNDGLIGFGNVTITEERREELTFSPPYMTNIASLITHESAGELTDFNDMAETFSGLDALAFEGTLHEERLRELIDQHHPDAGMEMAHSNDEIIDKLSAGNDYFAYLDLYNFWRAEEEGAPLKRHEIGDEAEEQFGYIMPPETTWEDIITEYFEHDGGLIHSQRYREIMEMHLGERLAGLLIDAHE